jgi:RND family efflux transporter MFP subunit
MTTRINPPPAQTLSPDRNGQPAPTPTPPEAANESRRRAKRRLVAIGALAAVALSGALAAGTLPRLRQQREVDAAAAEVAHSRPRVTVAVARPAAPTSERVLPGNCLALLEASLYARTTGYLQKRLVDNGDHVHKGQLLAVIDAPDVDDQLAQARANLALARANLKYARANARLAQITLERDELLLPSAVAAQQIDQDKATVATTAANVQSSLASIKVNEALVQRFTDLQRFQKIQAPFDGVITARTVDPGDLVTADSSVTTRELFHLMRTDIVRVLVNVPQRFATGIQVGQQVAVFRQEDPLQRFPGKVTRTAHALDPNTRTLLTEVQVHNPGGALRPGMYLQVQFTYQRKFFPVQIPSAALATRTGGPRVGVLDAENRVHYRPVQLGRDYGAQVEVIAGLKAGDTVVVHPGDDLAEGTAVQPVPLPTK